MRNFINQTGIITVGIGLSIAGYGVYEYLSKKSNVPLNNPSVNISDISLNLPNIQPTESMFDWNDQTLSRTFDNAKTISKSLAVKLNSLELYANCTMKIMDNKLSIIFNKCEYVPRKAGKKNPVPDIEHIAAASWYPSITDQPCWKDNRENCAKDNVLFKNFYTDLHNLYPALAEINRDRSNRRWCESNLKPTYGKTGFILDLNADCVTPPNNKKGDIARVMLYMNQQHHLNLSDSDIRMFNRWSNTDKITSEEIQRNILVYQIQKTCNQFISNCGVINHE